MISLPPGTKVFLACHPIDHRNGFAGLAAKARQIVGGDPFGNHPPACGSGCAGQTRRW
jgi:transposase